MKRKPLFLPYYQTQEETYLHRFYDCKYYDSCLNETLIKYDLMRDIRGKIGDAYVARRKKSKSKKEQVQIHHWRVAELKKNPMVRSFSCSRCGNWNDKYDLKKIKNKIKDELNIMSAYELSEDIKERKKELKKIVRRLDLALA